MADGDASGERDLAAGDFSSWLDRMQVALADGSGSDVPCGSCTACCTASQFVHIAPDEVETLARIPRELLFPAPRRPPGHMLVGYDEHGRCPMLSNGSCSIYEHRPRTCRTYDCRVFPAAGLGVDDGDKVAIAAQVRRWWFSFATPADRVRHDAVQAAAAYLRARRAELPDGAVPVATTQLAVLAIEMHALFLRRDGGSGEPAVTEPDLETVRGALVRR